MLLDGTSRKLSVAQTEYPDLISQLLHLRLRVFVCARKGRITCSFKINAMQSNAGYTMGNWSGFVDANVRGRAQVESNINENKQKDKVEASVEFLTKLVSFKDMNPV